MSDAQSQTEFDSLSVDEKIELVQSLWDRIASASNDVPVPEWHRTVIAERLAAHRANPNEARSWPAVRASVERNLRKRGG